jgi:hypothetical protein
VILKKINKKLEKSDGSNDDAYIMHVRRYAKRYYSGLGR